MLPRGKAAKSYPNPSESKKSKIDIPLEEKPVSDHCTVKLVDYFDDEDSSRRVVFRSEDERSMYQQKDLVRLRLPQS